MTWWAGGGQGGWRVCAPADREHPVERIATMVDTVDFCVSICGADTAGTGARSALRIDDLEPPGGYGRRPPTDVRHSVPLDP